MKYGKETLKYATVLLQRGTAYGDILEETGIPIKHLRVMKSRLNAPKKAKPVIVTSEKSGATLENETLQTVENVTKEDEAETFFQSFNRTRNAADLIYYVGVLIACAGIVQSLPVVGYAVSFVYVSGAVIALVNIKTRRGFLALLPHFLMLAFVEAVGFVGHTVWANNAFWGNVKALPLNVYVQKYRDDVGEIVAIYGGADVETPFKMAVGVAVIMLISAVYVCAVSVQNSKKRAQ